MGELFKQVNHRVWVGGTTIYEHVVETARQPDFKYVIVETPSDLALMYKNWPDGVELSDSAKKRYFATRAEQKIKNGERGEGNKAFEKAAAQFVGGTRDVYIKATKDASEETLMRYATSVPHVMIYPARGGLRLLKPARPVKIAKPTSPGPS